MGHGERVKPGLGHGGIICVLQTQFSFFWGGLGGREQGNWPFTLREHWKITHYF